MNKLFGDSSYSVTDISYDKQIIYLRGRPFDFSGCYVFCKKKDYSVNNQNK